MNDEPQNDATDANPPRSGGGTWSIVLLLFMLLLAVGAFGYGYYELSRVNLALAQSVSSMRAQLEANQSNVTLMQQNVARLQQGQEKTQAVTVQQEQLMNEWRAAQQGNKDKWQLAEAQSLVKMANDQLQFAANVPLAIILLQQADQSLQQTSAASNVTLRKAIATDIATLQAIPAVDTTAIYLKLNALNTQVDKLPLPTNPLAQSTKPDKAATTDYSKLSWWNATVARSRDMLQQVVVVRNTNTNALPLVMPEERMFLYQNMHAQLENALWAVLHHNTAIYQASLDRAMSWAVQYFAQDDALTKNMLQQLQALRAMPVESSAKNVLESLGSLDNQAPAVTTTKTNESSTAPVTETPAPVPATKPAAS